VTAADIVNAAKKQHLQINSVIKNLTLNLPRGVLVLVDMLSYGRPME